MLERLLTDKQVEKRYVKAGRVFGNAVSYIYMGECIGFNKMLTRWQKWEAEYARRGYHTLSLDNFIASGGYEEPLTGLSVKRSDGEESVFYAQIYREEFLGKFQPVITNQE